MQTSTFYKQQVGNGMFKRPQGLAQVAKSKIVNLFLHGLCLGTLDFLLIIPISRQAFSVTVSVNSVMGFLRVLRFAPPPSGMTINFDSKFCNS